MPNPVKLRATVISLSRYGDGTYFVRLKPDSPVPRFKPGQFLHLTVDEFDPAGGFWPESRVFSIASAPGQAEVEIIFSVKGHYTKRMEQILEPGLTVWLKLPYGNFIINSIVHDGRDIVVVAGGTGISPFLPYLYELKETRKKERIVRLYYGVREKSLILASSLIESCADAGLIDPRVLIESEQPEVGTNLRLKIEYGRLDIDRINGESSDLVEPIFFLSGPPGMIKSFKEKLGLAGVESNRIHIDEWE